MVEQYIQMATRVDPTYPVLLQEAERLLCQGKVGAFLATGLTQLVSRVVLNCLVQLRDQHIAEVLLLLQNRWRLINSL